MVSIPSHNMVPNFSKFSTLTFNYAQCHLAVTKSVGIAKERLLKYKDTNVKNL